MSPLLSSAIARHAQSRADDTYVGTTMFHAIESYLGRQRGDHMPRVIASVDEHTTPEEVLLLMELSEEGTIVKIHTSLSKEQFKALVIRGAQKTGAI